MKFFAILALVLPAVSALAPTVTMKRDALSINPAPESLSPKAAVTPSDPVATPETNAQRMARGLTPLAPRNLRRHKTSRANPPRQSQSPSTPYSGIIEARDASGNRVGYLSNGQNIYGEWKVDSNVANALPISFSASSDGGIFSIDASGPSTYPKLGGVVGYANSNNNLGPNTYNYFYLAAVKDTAEGPATASDNSFSDSTGIDEDTESDIWKLDPATGALTLNWFNDDSSEPTCFVRISDSFFAITSDPAAFDQTFGTSQGVSLFLVSA